MQEVRGRRLLCKALGHLYEFPTPAVVHHHNLSGREQHKLNTIPYFRYPKGSSGIKSRRRQSCAPSGSSRGRTRVLAFSDFQRPPAFLGRGSLPPPLKGVSPTPASSDTDLPASPRLGSLLGLHWVQLNDLRSSSHLKILNHICSLFLPRKVTYSEVPGTGHLGRGEDTGPSTPLGQLIRLHHWANCRVTTAS